MDGSLLARAMGMGQSQCLREVAIAKLFFHKTLSPFLTEKVETNRVIKTFLRNLILIF